MPADPRPRGGKVAFVTYTMAHPFAVGVFFRALRLGFEFHRRGWSFTICNAGPLPDDPKVRLGRELGEIVELPGGDDDGKLRAGRELLRRLDPDLIVFGEGPFPSMEPYYRGARMLGPPFAVLDQFYDPRTLPQRWGVDLLLLYGVASLWEGQGGQDDPGYAVVPPFIEEVTAADRLPVPAPLLGAPWVMVLGFDERVLRGGIELFAAAGEEGAAIVTVSAHPGEAGRLLDRAGIAPGRRATLPLLADPDLFGLFAASRVAIVANGFMQMMEALALGCPAICIDRGIGMESWSLDDVWRPYISLGESPEQQRERLAGWLRHSPFSAAQRAALARERGGAKASVDLLTRVARHPRPRPRLERLGSRLRWLLLGQPPPEAEAEDLTVEIAEGS